MVWTTGRYKICGVSVHFLKVKHSWGDMEYRLLQVAECSGTLASAVFFCPPFFLTSGKWSRRWNSCVIWVFSVGSAPGTVRKTTHVAPLLSVESDAFRVTLDFSWFFLDNFRGPR